MTDTIMYLNSLPNFSKFSAEKNGPGKTKVRVMKENEDSYFVFAPRSRKRGYRFTLKGFISLHSPIIESSKTKNEKWQKSIARCLKEIERTGLWKGSEVHKMLQNLATMDFSDREAIMDILRTATSVNYREYPAEAFGEFIKKYPFVFREEGEGNVSVVCEYVDTISNMKLKSPYFGRDNKWVKERLAQSIEKGVEDSAFARVNYDVSFNLKKGKDGILKAYYSEAYKDCGNGHYYIAFSENLALFVEDD